MLRFLYVILGCKLTSYSFANSPLDDFLQKKLLQPVEPKILLDRSPITPRSCASGSRCCARPVACGRRAALPPGEVAVLQGQPQPRDVALLRRLQHGWGRDRVHQAPRQRRLRRGAQDPQQTLRRPAAGKPRRRAGQGAASSTFELLSAATSTASSCAAPRARARSNTCVAAA